MTKYCLAIGTDVVDQKPRDYATWQEIMLNNDNFPYPLICDVDGRVVIKHDISELESVALEYFREHTNVSVIVAREYFRVARSFEREEYGRHLVSKVIVNVYLPGDEPKTL